MALYDEGDCFQVQLAPANYLVSWTNQVRGEFFMIFSELKYDKPATAGDWTREGDMNEVRYLYRHYPDPVTKILRQVEHCEKWRIIDSVEGANWVSESGKVLLIGDAIHGMPPHLGQGFGQGIEDAVSLCEFLHAIPSTASIPSATRAFASFRHPRTTKIQAASRNNLAGFTLPDGPYQQARDEKLRTTKVDDAAVKAWRDAPVDPNADFLDHAFLKWVLSCDAVDEVSVGAVVCCVEMVC